MSVSSSSVSGFDAPLPAGQRFLPRDRESFFDAQARNRRTTWRLSALCVIAAVIMGIPLALVVTPLLYGVALIVADTINLFSPLSPAFWRLANEIARFGIVAFESLLQHKAADPRTLVLGTAVLLLPGAAFSVLLWLGINAVFRRAGVGGALLALKAREPNQGELKELQLADVVEEMAIAAGLPAPRVVLVDAPGANAAVIGTSPEDARIVVSRRLIDDLNRDELEGVLARLIASIGNGDLRIAFRVTAIFEACGLLVAIINSPFGPQSRRTLWRIVRCGLSGSGNNPQEAAAVADLLTRSVTLESDDIDRFFDPTTKRSKLRSLRNFLFFPIFFTNFAVKLSLWFFSGLVLGPSVALLWRTRQYLADASAVQLTRNPDGLSSALQRLNQDSGEVPGGGWASHLFVVDPKHSGRMALDPATAQQFRVLAQAWDVSAGGTSQPAQDDAAKYKEASAVFRAAVMGDTGAVARIHAFTQALSVTNPDLAAKIPSPADLAALRTGDPAALVRLRALGTVFGQQSPRRTKTQEQSPDASSWSALGFHPSLKRRLKRLERMGAHIKLEASDSKTWIVGLVFGLIFSPFFLLILALFLLLISIMVVTSMTFLVIWLAFIHQAFALIAHH